MSNNEHIIIIIIIIIIIVVVVVVIYWCNTVQYKNIAYKDKTRQCYRTERHKTHLGTRSTYNCPLKTIKTSHIHLFILSQSIFYSVLLINVRILRLCYQKGSEIYLEESVVVVAGRAVESRHCPSIRQAALVLDISRTP